MTVDEARTRLRAKLEETYGVDGAAILMDRPPGGWGDLVTHESLHREFATFESRFDLKLAALESRIDLKFVAFEARSDAKFAAIDHRFDRFEHQLLGQVDRRLRAQSWITISTVIGAMGMIVALVRL